MKRFLLLLISYLCLLGCDKTLGNYEVISSESAYEMLKNENIQLIDVRTPKEYKEGFIKNAKNIDYFSENFLNEISKLDKHTPLILYCRSGKRSGKSAKKISELGFKKVYDIEGGILKWKSKGLVLEN